jgi:hypothetical protein
MGQHVRLEQQRGRAVIDGGRQFARFRGKLVAQVAAAGAVNMFFNCKSRCAGVTLYCAMQN